MKLLRGITLSVFVLTLCLFSLFYWKETQNSDHTYPALEVPREELLVQTNATQEDLLRDVKAYDEKDGDLTERILVESVSKFLEPGVCKITYAVADSDHHVSKAERTLRYEDYISPQFYLRQPLCFYENDKVNIREQIGATDCIDGDISNRVIVTGKTYSGAHSDSFILSVQVTNSHGDKAYLDLPVFVEENDRRDAEVELATPMIYVKTGTQPNFRSYIKSVNIDGMPVQNYTVQVSSDYNSQVPSVYSVHFYIRTENGHTGHTVLTVVAEE